MPRRLAFAIALLAALPAAAQEFPKLTGRVVDAAGLLSPATEAALAAKLERLETETTRQLVVATIPDLQDYPIEDYGYRLGRAWAIGQKDEDSGALLIVAPNERKVRVEVGYGLEGYLTDAWSSVMIQRAILPRFKAGDMEGGIVAGADAIIGQLALPADQARANLAAAREREDSGGRGLGLVPALFMIWFVFWMLRGVFGGKTYRRRGWGAPVVIWGPGMGGGWGGGSSRGGGGFGGGFSGGGGGFGGGGASGSW